MTFSQMTAIFTSKVYCSECAKSLLYVEVMVDEIVIPWCSFQYAGRQTVVSGASVTIMDGLVTTRKKWEEEGKPFSGSSKLFLPFV